MEAQPHEGIRSKASPNVPRPDPTTATRSKGLGRFRDMGMGVEKETLSPKAPNYHQTGQSRRATYSELCNFACKIQLFESGRCWVRTSDLCRVKAALSRGTALVSKLVSQGLELLQFSSFACVFALQMTGNKSGGGGIRTLDTPLRGITP